jgi:hypothetical protein
MKLTLDLRKPLRLLALLPALLASPAHAVDLAWSGFATLGWAQSDVDYGWQRYIRDEGTWNRDTVLGSQLDARLSPHWSATVQLRAAPTNDQDNAWSLDAAWAFVAWRPSNDWLLRAGKLRVPLYLYSETQDVGAATEFARLPAEQYWIAPTSDFTGLYATRYWAWGEADLSLDAYSGFANAAQRAWTTAGLPPLVAPGATYTDVRVHATGLVFTARQADKLWRIGVHSARTRLRDDQARTPVTFPRVDLAPGIGYWQVADALPGPGVPTVQRVGNLLVTGGLDWQLGDGWRLAAEATNVRQLDVETGISMRAGYIAMFKTVDRVTGYASLGRMLSSATQRDWSRRLTTEVLPPVVPGAAQINAVQTFVGERINAFDQSTLAVGLSYALTPTSRLKTEWAHTRIGSVSTMANPDPGKPWPTRTGVNVLSVNYSIVF